MTSENAFLLVTIYGLRLFRLLFRRVEFLFAVLCAEVLVVVVLVGLVDAHAREEHDAGGEIYLRVEREPDAFGQTRLLEDDGRAGLDRSDEAAADKLRKKAKKQ